jgi:hypothetical protein
MGVVEWRTLLGKTRTLSRNTYIFYVKKPVIRKKLLRKNIIVFNRNVRLCLSPSARLGQLVALCCPFPKGNPAGSAVVW